LGDSLEYPPFNGGNYLKYCKLGVIALLLFGMVIALTGIVCADQPVPAVPESQTLGTVTIADVDGLAMETDAGTWSISSGGIPLSGTDPVIAGYPGWTPTLSYSNFLIGWGFFHTQYPQATLQDWQNWIIANPSAAPAGAAAQAQDLLNWAKNLGGLHDPPLYSGEVRYTTAYDASIVAQAGHSVITKTMNIDTRNKVIGQSNIKADTAVTFIATSDGGNIVGSENLMLDGVANPTNASDRMLCPFASTGGNVIPAYCNIIQAGSKYDLTVGSVTTAANDKFVGTDATIPVVLNYAINVKPYMASGIPEPATGSAMAYVKAHIMESRSFNTSQVSTGETTGPLTITGTPTKSEDLTYSETSSVNGYINSFNKVIAYQSGKSLL
jgi:hypothetical protein